MQRLSATKAREQFSELLSRVGYGNERIVIQRQGKPVAALIPFDDLELLENMEDAADLRAVRESMAEPGKDRPLEEVRKELGL